MTNEEILRTAWHLTDQELTVLKASDYSSDGTSWSTRTNRRIAHNLFKRGLLERNYQDRNRYRVTHIGEAVLADRRWLKKEFGRGWG